MEESPSRHEAVISLSLPALGQGLWPGDLCVLGRLCDGCPLRAMWRLRGRPLARQRPASCWVGLVLGSCATQGAGWGRAARPGRGGVALSGLLGPLCFLMPMGPNGGISGRGRSFIWELVSGGDGGDKGTCSAFWLCARRECHPMVSSQPHEVRPATPWKHGAGHSCCGLPLWSPKWAPAPSQGLPCPSPWLPHLVLVALAAQPPGRGAATGSVPWGLSGGVQGPASEPPFPPQRLEP